MGKDLSHLTTEEITALVQRYYDGENVSKLMKEYNISVSASELYKLFPPDVYPDYSCEYCNEFLVANRLSKTAKRSHTYDELYCPVCGHRPFQSPCRCKNCLEKERRHRAWQLESIQQCYARPRTPVDFSSLSFENKVFLGALCRGLLSENSYEIKPYIGSGVLLAPTADLTTKVYANLFHNDIIAVSPRSPLETFDLNDAEFPTVFYRFKVIYLLNLIFPPNKEDLLTVILNPSYYSADYSEEALALWREIAVAECIEYLQYQLRRVNFEFSPGAKTYKAFEIILNDFSVSQIYGIIWRAVADASKLYLERGISKLQAANSVIGACERYAERAKLNGWDLSRYNRVKDLPQSILSLFYFNRVLGIGEMGFTVPPTIV